MTDAEPNPPTDKPPVPLPPILSMEEFEAACEKDLVDGWASKGIVYKSPPYPPVPKAPRFHLEPFEAIRLEANGEWRVKKIIPLQGVVAIYGASEAFKSFTAFDMLSHVALGWNWAGRKTKQAPVVYIAAEGAAGVRKRKVGFAIAHADRMPGAPVPFYLVSAAPNLGTGQEDLQALIAAIEATGILPGVIAIDTLAQSLGGADENGSGMMTFVANATALANHFRCCVVIVHHVPLGDDERMRGHGSLHNGADAEILTQRKAGQLATVLTVKKMKDEESAFSMTAQLDRIVIGLDEDGDEVSTLVIGRIDYGSEAKAGKPSTAVPPGRRLLMDMVLEAIDEAGEDFRSFPDGPMVRAVKDEAIRLRYYARIAEQAKPDEDANRLEQRQRKAFNRNIAAALAAKHLIARGRDGARMVWLP
jgi:AAA domain